MRIKLFSMVTLMAASIAGGWLVGPSRAADTDPSKPGNGEPKTENRKSESDDSQEFIFFGDSRPLFVRAHVRVDGKSYRAVWDEYVNKVMKFLDKDGDGVLSQQEIDRMPPLQFLTGSSLFPSPNPKGKSGNALDADKDGKATRAELAAYLKKHGAAPFQFQVGSAAPSAYGAKVILLGQPEPINASELNDAIFALLDKNKDGKLSREELAAAPAIFAKLDANDDEMITPKEIVPNAGSKSSYGFIKEQAAAAVVVSRVESTAKPQDSPVMLVDPAESGSALAQQLLKRYSPKNGKPAAKKLKAADLGMDQATFNELDADKDGALDAEELAQFTKRKPDVEVTLRIGKKGDKEPEAEGTIRPGVAATLEKTKSGLTLELGVTRIELRAGSPAADSSFKLSFRLRDQYINQFKMADADNNGYLDEKEAMKSPLFRNIFKALDTNGDGMLFEKEMVAYVDKVEDLQRAVRQGCVTLALSDRGSGVFDLIDRDHDGRLSVRELRGAVDLIARLDRDGDQKLDRVEIPRNYEMRVRLGPAGSGADFGNVVVIAKGRITGDFAAPDKGVGPVWFRKMDSNRDGDLSRREFLGSDEQFQRIDTDHDGLISLKEAEAFDKLTRKAAPK